MSNKTTQSIENNANTQSNDNKTNTPQTRIKELREEKGEKQENTAKALDISRSALSQYETGKFFPRFAVLERMSKHFDVSIDYLIGKSNDRKNTDKVAEISGYTGLSEDAIEHLHHYALFLRYDMGKNDISSEDDLKENYCSYPYISLLLSEYSIDEPFFVGNLEDELKNYVQSIKEISELKQQLPAEKKKTDDDIDRYLEYNNLTKGLINKYFQQYKERLELISLFREPGNSNYYIDDETFEYEISKIEIEMREITIKIQNELPSIDSDALDDLCEIIMGHSSYNRCISKINELKTQKARALLNIIEYIDDVAKDKPYYLEMDTKMNVYNVFFKEE